MIIALNACFSQVRSEAGKKGAQAKRFFAEANAKQNQAIQNQHKNIYKQTNTTHSRTSSQNHNTC